MRKVITLLFCLLSIYWIVRGFMYGIWVNNGPGGGLMPVIGGVITLTFIILDYFKNRQAKDAALDLRFLKLTGSVVLTVGAMYLVGIVISLSIFLLLWLVYAEKYSWVKSLSISSIVMFSIYAIFKMWLAVPFYQGLLGLI